MAPTRKDALIDTALELFSKHGFHATGIDRILAEAGVAKMTLYNHFKSKDALIVAALQRRGERFRDWLKSEVEGRARSPRKRLLAVFDVLEEWHASEAFSGDLFVNAVAEYGRSDDPVHVTAVEHMALVRDYLTGLASEAGARNAGTLADQLFLLMQGATVSAHASGGDSAARQARKTAKLLLRHAGV